MVRKVGEGGGGRAGPAAYLAGGLYRRAILLLLCGCCCYHARHGGLHAQGAGALEHLCAGGRGGGRNGSLPTVHASTALVSAGARLWRSHALPSLTIRRRACEGAFSARTADAPPQTLAFSPRPTQQRA